MEIKTDNSIEKKPDETGVTPAECVPVSSLIGHNIINRQGEALGKLHEIVIDITEGKIEYVVIEFGGFLGMNQKYFTVSFRELTLAREHRNAFILDETKESVKRFLNFDKDHWPDLRSGSINTTPTSIE